MRLHRGVERGRNPGPATRRGPGCVGRSLEVTHDPRSVAGKGRTLHKGALAPWDVDAATGRSLKDDEGVEYLTERQAGAIVKTYNDLYKTWLKENPDNN